MSTSNEGLYHQRYIILIFNALLIITYGTELAPQPNTRRSSRNRNSEATITRLNTLSSLVSRPTQARRKQVSAPTTGERGVALAAQKVGYDNLHCLYSVWFYSKIPSAHAPKEKLPKFRPVQDLVVSRILCPCHTILHQWYPSKFRKVESTLSTQKVFTLNLIQIPFAMFRKTLPSI